MISSSANPFRPNWPIIAFFLPVHLLALLAWPLYLYFGGGLQWQEIVVFFFMFALGAVGINVGYHRALSHLSFRMSKVMKFLALFGGASVAEGSALVWCADHRRHHKFQDTGNDPYNIKRGFWWAHMGWLLGGPTTTDFSNCPDLLRDPMIKNQHQYYVIWLISSCFLLPLGLGFLLGRPIACFALAGLMRLFLFNHFTYCINSYAHYFGRRPYSLSLTARDSLICSLIAHGEGWHNFHHKFPFDYRNGHKFYHYDPAKWIIYFGQFFGLTKNLKQTPAQEIYRARIQTQKRKLQTESRDLKTVDEALDHALKRWTEVGLEWAKFRADCEKRGSEQMRVISQNLKDAKQEFKWQYAIWKQTMKSANQLAN